MSAKQQSKQDLAESGRRKASCCWSSSITSLRLRASDLIITKPNLSCCLSTALSPSAVHETLHLVLNLEQK